MNRLKISLLAALCLWAGLGGQAPAQNEAVWIRPPRPLPAPVESYRRYELEKVALEAVLEGQKARCVLKYTLYNPGPTPLEVDFLAPLPDGGLVSGLTLSDGAQELPGQVYARDEAQAIYRDIVARLKDPALLEYAGRDLYRARVFPLPPRERRTLELNFDYLPPKSDGQVAFSFPLAGPMTAGRNPEQELNLLLKPAPGLGNVYSPSAGVKVEAGPGGETTVSYRSARVPLDRFLVYCQTEAGPVGGLVLSHRPRPDEDGYFLFLAEPALDLSGAKPEAAKNVVFVLDKSGSMTGKKFEQAQGALRFVLERLNPEDSFNLVDYNDRVFAWRPEMMPMNPENRAAALAYVANLRSGGATNIGEALGVSLNFFKDPSQPNYLIFLTDGQATTGERQELKLAEIAREANRGRARVFSFGLGFDLNARLLDRLSGQAGGTSVFVNPDENLETKVAAFFSRLTAPALTRPRLTADRPLNRTLPETLPDLFGGQQLVAVGRYPQGGPATFTLRGELAGEGRQYDYPVRLAEGPATDGQFIASLWAQRRIGEIIDQLDLAGGEPNSELVAELVELSKKYGILTPYTSFLALEDQALDRAAELASRTTANLSAMDQVAGAGANLQRAVKGQMKAADRVAPAAPAAFQDSALAHPMMLAATEVDRKVAEALKRETLTLPQTWGGTTFFLKNGVWRAAELSDDEVDRSRTVVQFSESFFALAAKFAPDQLAWLSRSEPVVFKFQGEVYRVEPEPQPAPAER